MTRKGNAFGLQAENTDMINSPLVMSPTSSIEARNAAANIAERAARASARSPTGIATGAS